MWQVAVMLKFIKSIGFGGLSYCFTDHQISKPANCPVIFNIAHLGRGRTLNIKTQHYSVIFQSLLKNQPHIPVKLYNEILSSLDALDQSIINDFDLTTDEMAVYKQMNILAKATNISGEKSESYVELKHIVDGMIAGSGLSYDERNVLLALKKLIDRETLSHGGVSGDKFGRPMSADDHLTQYQKTSLDLLRASVDGGEAITVFSGPGGSGKMTVLNYFSTIYQLTALECAPPTSANITMHQVNAYLAKCAVESEKGTWAAKIVVFFGGEVLFSPDNQPQLKFTVPNGIQYIQTVLADDMRFFGRKIATIDMPLPTKEHISFCLGKAIPDVDQILEAMTKKNAFITFDTVTRVGNLLKETTIDDAVAIVSGKTMDCYSDHRGDASPNEVMKEIRSRVFFQEEAMTAIETILKRNNSGFKPDGRLAGAFLFAGPTGTGKTETALALSTALRFPLLRIDLSEYAMPHTIQRLIGAPPSYIGYNDGAILSDFIKKHPTGVILLDEAEKASREVTQLFLGMLDSGFIKTQKGETLDCTPYWVIFTSNAGMTYTSDVQTPLGFAATPINIEAQNVHEKETNKMSRAGVDLAFSPEFRNRLDRVVHFKPLAREVSYAIVEKIIATLTLQVMRRKNIALTVTPEVIAYLAEVGYSQKDGARALRRAVESQISDAVAAINVRQGSKIMVYLENSKVMAKLDDAVSTDIATESSSVNVSEENRAKEAKETLKEKVKVTTNKKPNAELG
jgi:ATP-dependent protease Clp ATPase subunit